MDSRRLTAAQIERVRAVIVKQSDYLHRLICRMGDLKWRSDDPLWVAAHRACVGVEELLKELVVRRKPGGRLP